MDDGETGLDHLRRKLVYDLLFVFPVDMATSRQKLHNNSSDNNLLVRDYCDKFYIQVGTHIYCGGFLNLLAFYSKIKKN